MTEKDKPTESEISLVAPTAENGKDGAEDEGGESEIAEEDQEIGDALADSQIPDVWWATKVSRVGCRFLDRFVKRHEAWLLATWFEKMLAWKNTKLGVSWPTNQNNMIWMIPRENNIQNKIVVDG